MTAAAKLNPLLRKAKREGWAEWIVSEHDERAVLNGCYFDVDGAEHVRDFFRMFLRHSKGKWAGQAFKIADWQWRDFIGPVFGWMRADGLRRVRKCYGEVPKKNGKSTLGSGVGLYLLCGDNEPGAEIYSVATKRDQAAIVWREAMSMCRSSKALLTHLRLNASTHVITHPKTESRYAALASDSAGTEGLNIHGLIVDELHAWKDRAYWDTLRYGCAARTQPLVCIFTTAGVFDKESLGWQEHSYALRWLAGEVEDQEYRAFVYAAAEDDDPFDPEVHRKANPSYEITIDPTEIAKAAADAKEKPSEYYGFLRYRLDRWTEAVNSWLDLVSWDACGDAQDEAQWHGRKATGGLDLASLIDLTAWMVLLHPTDEDPKYRLLSRYWVPRAGATQRAKKDQIKYLEWARHGHLTLTDGSETYFGGIVEQIKADRQNFAFAEASINADPWNLAGIRQVVDPESLYIIECPQNFQHLSAATKKMEAMVLGQTFFHDDNPITRWCMSNVGLLTDTNGNVRISKKHSTEKVDGAAGAVMAVAGVLDVQEEEPAGSIEVLW